jgi:hypothetical protein
MTDPGKTHFAGDECQPPHELEGKVREKAAAFCRGELSAAELYKWFASREFAIEDDLEADLWGLVFEIANGKLDDEGVRRWLAWLAEEHSLPVTSENAPREAQARQHNSDDYADVSDTPRPEASL